MLIVMRNDATDQQIDLVMAKIKNKGFTPLPLPGTQRTAIGVVGNESRIDSSEFEILEGIKEIIHVSKPYKLAGREFFRNDTIINVEGVSIGGRNFTVIAGPCSVESREQIIKTAELVKISGAGLLRGGAFKPRTGPYSFQGLGKEGLEYLEEAKKISGMPIVTELMHLKYLDLVMEYADVIQVGARNMQNYDLLQELGAIKKPVLLKRGMAATMEEFLLAAEYILNGGNKNVILCERGIRTFERSTRNTLDLSIVSLIRELSHLPVIVDPSHGTGRRSLVAPMSFASMACGASGLMLEVHPDPKNAVSDAAQSITPEEFAEIMSKLKSMAMIFDKICP